MGYIPVFLDVSGQKCIVIGRGHAVEEKIRALLDAGAIVTVVSPDAKSILESIDGEGVLKYVTRDYQDGDLRGNLVAYIANASHEVAQRAVAEARQLGILVNVADNPEASSFISPAIVRRGDLQIAISTGGSSPSVAAMMRQRLERQLGSQYSVILQVMRRAREFLRQHQPESKERRSTLRSLAAALLDSVETLDLPTIDRLLRVHLNVGMAELGLELQVSLPAKRGPLPNDI